MTGLIIAIGEAIWSLALLIFAIGFLYLVKPIRDLMAMFTKRNSIQRMTRLIRTMRELSSAELHTHRLQDAAAPRLTQSDLTSE